MSSDDILQLIPEAKLPELRNIFKQNWPAHIHVYYLIDTCIQWKKSWPNENLVNFYCPNGSFEDGTFIAIIETYCYDVFIYTLETSLKRLELFVRETKLIDWTKKPLLTAVHQNFFDMIVKVGKTIGHPVVEDLPSYVWWLPKEKALEFDCSLPPEIYVAPLNTTHVSKISAVWPNRLPNSEKFLAKIIKLNDGLGLFLKSNNDLCAWVLKTYFGGLGMLQTAEEHKRKGYGSLVTKLMSKLLAEQNNDDICCAIVVHNLASQNMFMKLGFKKITPVSRCWY